MGGRAYQTMLLVVAACAAPGGRNVPAEQASAARRPPPAGGRVRPGIDVLLADSAHLLHGRRVGLVTNQTGVDARGHERRHRGSREAGANLVALFSPEHGFRGAAAPGAAVASTVDSATGLPIYSLYGRTTAPTPEMLQGVDLMLVDLQDAGARYYTYLATTVEVMRAAAERGIRVVVLDRPNPIGGAVQGNVLDPAYATIVGRIAVPMRHGLTIAELARLAAADLGLPSPGVVPLAGWRRASGVRRHRAALRAARARTSGRSRRSFIIPGSASSRAPRCRWAAARTRRSSSSARRGSIRPPCSPALRAAALPGVRVPLGRRSRRARRGTAGLPTRCVAGIRLAVTDRATYDPTRTAVHLLAAIRAVHPDRIGWIPRHFDRLAGGPSLREAIVAGQPPAAIAGGWRPEPPSSIAE